MRIDLIRENASFDTQIRCLYEHAWIAHVNAGSIETVERVYYISRGEKLACF